MKIASINLNWQELGVARDSVRRLLKEPEVDFVWVVDNGSTDGSKEYFRGLKEREPRFGFVDLPKNCGPSVARNIAIQIVEADAIFLLDSDILYVPGTIREYAKILKKYPDAFCVGNNSFETVMSLGYNGVDNAIDADITMPDDYTISDWFPMSWTQYGLYRADLLKKTPFCEEGPFGHAGYGFEDDWHWHEMNKQGYVSLAVNAPLYFHEAHTGVKELMRSQTREAFEANMKLRKGIFEKKWGKRSQWSESLVDSPRPRTTRHRPE